MAGALLEIFDRLYASHGPQGWWPGATPFEVMVGAVLTQNTSWSNVERAIANLADADVLDARRILALAESDLAQLLRPAGYFNVKARRLRNFCRWYVEQGGHAALVRIETDTLRRSLLAINGIGPETADDILLYAFERPVFVIDAYTRRVFSRLGVLEGDAGYEELRRRFEVGLAGEIGKSRRGSGRPPHLRSLTGLYNEYHALIVFHGKTICRPRPLCAECPLARICPGPDLAIRHS